MFSIESCPLPAEALLRDYTRDGVYTDCFRTEVRGNPSHADYIRAFYTTRLFKLERLVLRWILSKPSSDDEAIRLANGETDRFAAWQTEKRGQDQILLTDVAGRTRSWLMIEPGDDDANRPVRLYFGSAVIRVPRSGGASGLAFALLIRFHRLYSVLLLYSAKRRLLRRGN